MTKEVEQVAAAKAKREAEEAKERVVKAGNEAERAREAEATANKEVDGANERVDRAAAEVKSAMEAEVTAKREAEEAKGKSCESGERSRESKGSRSYGKQGSRGD